MVCGGPGGSWGSFTVSPPNPEVPPAPHVLTRPGSLSTSHPSWKPWGLWTLQAGTLHLPLPFSSTLHPGPLSLLGPLGAARRLPGPGP